MCPLLHRYAWKQRPLSAWKCVAGGGEKQKEAIGPQQKELHIPPSGSPSHVPWWGAYMNKKGRKSQAQGSVAWKKQTQSRSLWRKALGSERKLTHTSAAFSMPAATFPPTAVCVPL